MSPEPEPQRVSDSLPHPAVVDQQATENARAFAEVATRPAPAFTPPPVSSWEGTASDEKFTPPPVSAWEGPTTKPSALSRLGTGLYESTVGPVVSMATHPHPLDNLFDTVKQSLGISDLQAIHKAVEGGKYKVAALLMARHLTTSAGDREARAMVEPILADVKSGNYAGAAGGASGTALMLFGPKLLPKVARVLADTKAVTGAKGAIVEGTKAALSRNTMVGAAGAEYLATHAGLPPGVATAAVAGPRVVSAAIRGGKAALAKRLQAAIDLQKATEAAERAKVPLREPAWRGNPDPVPAEIPDVTPVYTDLPSGRVPGRPVSKAPPARPPARTPIWEGQSSAPNAEVPMTPQLQPTGVLPSGRVPGTGVPRAPLNSAQQTIAKIQEIAQREPASPPAVESPQSGFNADGSRKSPQMRAAEITNMNRMAKAGRFADALKKGGLRMADVMRMDEGHWKMLADGIDEKIPSPDTRAAIIKAMKPEVAQAPATPSAAAVPTPEPPAPSTFSPKSLSLMRQLEDEMRRSGTIQ